MIGKMLCACTWVQNTSAGHPLLQTFSLEGGGGRGQRGRHFTVSGDVWGCHRLRAEHVPGIQWVETRDAAKHPIRHRMVSHKKSSRLKCQWFQGWKNCYTVRRYMLRPWNCPFPHDTEPLSLTHACTCACTHACTCTHTHTLNAPEYMRFEGLKIVI